MSCKNKCTQSNTQIDSALKWQDHLCVSWRTAAFLEDILFYILGMAALVGAAVGVLPHYMFIPSSALVLLSIAKQTLGKKMVGRIMQGKTKEEVSSFVVTIFLCDILSYFFVVLAFVMLSLGVK